MFSDWWWLTYVVLTFYMYIAALVIANFYCAIVIDAVAEKHQKIEKRLGGPDQYSDDESDPADSEPDSIKSELKAFQTLLACKLEETQKLIKKVERQEAVQRKEKRDARREANGFSHKRLARALGFLRLFSFFLLSLHVVTCILYGQWNEHALLYYYDISSFMEGDCKTTDGRAALFVTQCDGVNLTHWDSQSEYITLSVLSSVLFAGHLIELTVYIASLGKEAFYLSKEDAEMHPFSLSKGVQWSTLWKLVISAPDFCTLSLIQSLSWVTTVADQQP